MPSPISSDLRRRIVNARENDEQNRDQIAERFAVGVATVSRLLARWRKTGSVEPKPHGGGQKPLIYAENLDVLHGLVEAQPDAFVPELVEQFGEATGVWVSPATMSRTLARLGLTRKKRRSMRRNATASG